MIEGSIEKRRCYVLKRTHNTRANGHDLVLIKKASPYVNQT